MRLRIAGIGCELAGIESVCPAALRRYAPFSSTLPPSIRLSVARADRPPGVDHDWDAPMVTVRSLAGPDQVRIERADNPFSAEVDFARGLGYVAIQDNEYCLDSFLRVLYSILLARRGGLLLHAAGLVCDGRAVLCAGKSEAGKTTVSRQGFSEVLADELVAVIQADGRWIACGTPFWGEFVAGDNPGCAEVAGLYLLRKGLRHEVRDVSRSAALVETLGCCFFFGPERLTPAVFETCGRLVDDRLAGEMAVRPEPSVVGFVAKEAMRDAG